MKDILLVRCLNNKDYIRDITIDKVYEVIKTIDNMYFIIDDIGIEYGYLKNRFEIVKEVKQVKEYKGWEIAKMIYEGDLKDGDLITRVDNNKKVNKQILNKCISEVGDFIEQGSSFLTTPQIRFVIVPKSVDFMDCINSDSKCKVEHYRIKELMADDRSYKWLEEYQDLDDILHAIGEEFNTMACKEIIRDGAWYLEN